MIKQFAVSVICYESITAIVQCDEKQIDEKESCQLTVVVKSTVDLRCIVVM